MSIAETTPDCAIVVTVKGRGQFSGLFDRGSVVLRLPPNSGDVNGSVPLEQVVLALAEILSSPEDTAVLEQVAYFCNGRLLKADDPVHDKETIHILSPVTGG